jgi:hypothetical protein
MKENGFAFFDKFAERIHEFIDFLRGQNGGRLIENQNLRLAIEHFENFDLLLHPDRHVLDFLIQINGEMVMLA